MKKVSIIIPVYNTAEKYINECITSVLNQTYENIEVILIDDNSQNETKYLLERLEKSDKRIHLFRLNDRKGVGFARNYGLTKATGEFIYFLDSDDYLPERTLDLLVQHIKDFSFIRGRVHKTSLASSFALIFDGLNNIKMYCDDNKFRLINNRSVHNFLFKKKFIQKHNLKFSEDVRTYSDLYFMVPALIECHCVPHVKEAVYFERKRQDPIKDPALSQLDVSLLIPDFLTIYNQLKSEYTDEMAHDFLDKQFLNFYRKDIVTYFKNNRAIASIFSGLSKAVNNLHYKNVRRYDYFLRRELRHLFKGNKSAYRRINRQHHFLRDMRKGFKSREAFYNFLYKRFFTKLKKKQNFILFESFQGKSYSDNPKYIYEYMQKQKMEYQFIWSLNEKHNLPGQPKQVKHLSLRYFYYLARSKYWVVNARMPNYLEKKMTRFIYRHGTEHL